MPADSIRFYHRYKKTYEAEEVYGEKWLRFIYEKSAGQALLWLAAKRSFFSRIYGWQMTKRVSAIRVLPFIVKYNIDVEEFVKSPFDYKSFNDFFYRALKREARPIAEGESVAVFPADGRHLVFPNVDDADGFYVKGAKFSLADLLADAKLGEAYAGGAMVISRLCPVDYHRFHFATAGVPSESLMIRGPLFSVNPIALRKHIDYLVQNKRMLTALDSPVFGPVVCMEVGATNVGGIVQTYIANRPTPKGAEKGLFKFGGSCVITLFKRDVIKFDADIVAQSRDYIETYARMGDRMGIRK